MNKPLLNPDYILCETASVASYPSGEVRDGGPIVTEDDVAWIENECGMGSGAWDCVSPESVILAAWKRFSMKMKGEAPL